VVFLFALCQWVAAQDRRDQYYQMINDISAGKNYYHILGVEEDATAEEIKKRYRTLAIRFHPDKNKTKGAEQMYIDLSTAQEILLDPTTRRQYDQLINEGIPWRENYYGKYAYNMGAPDHDIRYVLMWLIIFITISKHGYQYQHYNNVLEQCKKTSMYKMRYNQHKLLQEQKKGPHEEFHFEVVGCAPPKWEDLFVLQLIRAPYDIGLFLFNFFRYAVVYRVLGREIPEEDMEGDWRKRAGMEEVSDEEWEKYKRKAVESQEKRMHSAKFRRARRMWKKYERTGSFN